MLAPIAASRAPGFALGYETALAEFIVLSRKNAEAYWNQWPRKSAKPDTAVLIPPKNPDTRPPATLGSTKAMSNRTMSTSSIRARARPGGDPLPRPGLLLCRQMMAMISTDMTAAAGMG